MVFLVPQCFCSYSLFYCYNFMVATLYFSYWGHGFLEWTIFDKVLLSLNVLKCQKKLHIPPTVPIKHTNCTIFYVSRSLNIKTIWNMALVYPLCFQIYGNYWYFMKMNHIYGWFENMGPLYKPYDYNFKRIYFKHKNI
jgi:hypothetical protein